MPKFNVTFGVKHSREAHPVLGFIHPNGYVSIIAEDYTSARDEVVKQLGTSWGFIYPEGDLTPSLYPLGEIFAIEEGAPQIDVKFVHISMCLALDAAREHAFSEAPVWTSDEADNLKFIFDYFNY